MKDCQRLAADLGWTVGEEYVDNDISAYSGKKRPAYERMLDDLADGTRDAVLCYHPDRLTRRPMELEQFVETVSGAGVDHVQFVAGGGVDLGNGDNLLLLRIQGAVAANESASKSRRVRRKMEEIAEAGQPHGGSVRPFGFEADRITHHPVEADVVRQLVARYIAGESLRSLAVWLDTEGITTSTGRSWQTTALRNVLRSPRIAGLREYRGEIVGEAVWEPIITPPEREKVLARMAERATSNKRTPQRYLLSGLARCGKCGGTLYSAARTEAAGKRTRRYVCQSGPDHLGCGKLTVVAEPLEELVTAAVLYRLDSPELADRMAGREAQDIETARLSRDLADDISQHEDLAAMFGRKEITAREWMAARKPIEARIEDTRRKLATRTQSDALAGVAGQGDRLRTEWPDLPLTRQHAIIAALVDRIEVGPGQRGSRTLDPERVDVHWRV